VALGQQQTALLCNIQSDLNPEVAFQVVDAATQEKLTDLPGIVKAKMQTALDSL
jgi:hypothetical protein